MKISELVQNATPPTSVPVTTPLPGQVANSTGGYAFAVGPEAELTRFLILGVGESMYRTEQDAYKAFKAVLDRCTGGLGVRAVEIVKDVSLKGRAKRQDETIFALAYLCASTDRQVAQAALDIVPAVCRTFTMLAEFNSAVESMRGRGSGLNRAVRAFYEGDPNKVAYQMVKYRQRNGWKHEDLLRLVKPRGAKLGPQHNALFGWATGKDYDVEALPAIIKGFEQVQKATTGKQAASVLGAFPSLPWETLPTNLLNDKVVWAALVPTMGIGALVRNLGRLSACGFADSNMSDGTAAVVARLKDFDGALKARLHPLAVLLALRAYESGKGKSGTSWKPVGNIVGALDRLFVETFRGLQPSGLRTMVGLDVSGSMAGSLIPNTTLTARDASAAMSLIHRRTDDRVEFVAFSKHLSPVDVLPQETVQSMIRKINNFPFQSTNQGLLVEHAIENRLQVDLFVCYTDSEANAGSHVTPLLRKYRKEVNPTAKLAVVAMAANQFSVADAKGDPHGQADFVGFDASTPELLGMFGRGEL